MKCLYRLLGHQVMPEELQCVLLVSMYLDNNNIASGFGYYKIRGKCTNIYRMKLYVLCGADYGICWLRSAAFSLIQNFRSFCDALSQTVVCNKHNLNIDTQEI